jgi:hypothetical protein
MIDAAAKEDQIRIEQARIAAQKEIAGMQLGAKVGKDKADLEAKQQIEGMRLGAEVARTKAQVAQQDRQSIRQSEAQMRNQTKPTKGKE